MTIFRLLADASRMSGKLPLAEPSRSLPARRSRLRDRRGIIVLGPLIAFVVLLVVMVVAGKLFYPTPRGTYVTPPVPELNYAVSPTEVYSGDRLAQRLRPGDAVWVVRLDNGSAVVFRDRTGREVIGVAGGLLESSRPRAPG